VPTSFSEPLYHGPSLDRPGSTQHPNHQHVDLRDGGDLTSEGGGVLGAMLQRLVP